MLSLSQINREFDNRQLVMLGLILVIVVGTAQMILPASKNAVDPNATLVRFTATFPGDESAWRSKHARRISVPSTKYAEVNRLQTWITSEPSYLRARGPHTNIQL